MPERRREITDPRALRALAHPLRLALLDRLMAFGEQTAAECAEAVGSTASNCSYHLRVLARSGLAEPGTSADGRERPWRPTATGLSFGSAADTDSPAVAAAARTLDELELARDEALTRQAFARRAELSGDWRDAETNHTYALRIAPDELRRLTEQIDALVRPYISLTRGPAPADADVAHLRLIAFRHPQVP